MCNIKFTVLTIYKSRVLWHQVIPIIHLQNAYHLLKLSTCALSPVRLFAPLWSVARQAPLSMGFPRQE